VLVQYIGKCPCLPWGVKPMSPGEKDEKGEENIKEKEGRRMIKRN
jgi:hypothetical protein